MSFCGVSCHPEYRINNFSDPDGKESGVKLFFKNQRIAGRLEVRREIIVYPERPVRKKVGNLEEISILMNSVYYYLGSAFILKSGSKYRLVVIHNGRILWDANYSSARGGRVAFSRLYGDRGWVYGMKPQWTPFYDPDSEYIDENREAVRKYPF